MERRRVRRGGGRWRRRGRRREGEGSERVETVMVKSGIEWNRTWGEREVGGGKVRRRGMVARVERVRVTEVRERRERTGMVMGREDEGPGERR